MTIVLDGTQELREAEPRRDEDDARVVDPIDVDGARLHSLEDGLDQRKESVFCDSGGELGMANPSYRHEHRVPRTAPRCAEAFMAGAILPSLWSGRETITGASHDVG
ncbi:MAG TPA: hypothetical protein VG408_08745 [Actinomycetota bacterium]|nr:hypothetical protein [Actinomycetota bacterium]